MGFTWFNNWLSNLEEEFIVFCCDVKVSDGCLILSAGLLGLGFVLAFDLSRA